MKKISGVYEILNLLNNHRYIGSSVDIEKRFKEHLNLLKNNKHHSKHLQKAWNKYGEKHFDFSVLEYCEPIKDTLLLLEQKYLDLNPEYNICKIAGNTQGVVFTRERKNKIGIANSKRIIKKETRLKHSRNSLICEWNNEQRKPILMLDKYDNIVTEFNSISQAARYTGHLNHRVCIKRVLDKEKHTAYGYKWRLKK